MRDKPKILYPVKITFKIKAEIKTFSGSKAEKNHYQQIGNIRNVKGCPSRRMKIIPDGLIKKGVTTTTSPFSYPSTEMLQVRTLEMPKDASEPPQMISTSSSSSCLMK